MLKYSRLNTPPGDGDVLIEPAFGTFESSVAENLAYFGNYNFELCGEHFSSYRRNVRESAGLDLDRPVVAVGHQPEFPHCGVWAKGVVCHHLASRLGAVGVQALIDHDRLKTNHLVVPCRDSGRIKTSRVVLHEGEPVELYEQLPLWSAGDIQRIGDGVRNIEPDIFRESRLSSFLSAFTQCRAPRDWVSQYAFARSMHERELGIELAVVRASLMDYGQFFAELFASAPRFAATYNSALATYRRRLGIRGNRHPMPDLEIENDRVELPIWIRASQGVRQRLHVRRAKGRLEVYAGEQLAHELPAFDSWKQAEMPMADLLTTYELRPRALAFTLWARLFLSDFFIHGIGGAKYDRITDLIIREYFGIQPPKYACVSATMMLELPCYQASSAELTRLRRRLRDMRHNPQRYLKPMGAVPDLLLRRKTAVAEAVRLRNDAPDDSPARSRVFRRVRDVNQELGVYCEGEMLSCTLHLAELEWQLKSDVVANSREYFHGLFPATRLAKLKARLTGQVSAVRS